MDISKTSEDSLFRVIHYIIRRESQKRNNAGRKERALTNKAFIYLAIYPFIIAFFFAFIYKFYSEHEVLKILGLISLLISYIGLILQPFITAYIYKNSIKQFFTSPLSKMLSISKEKASVDKKALRYLLAKEAYKLSFLKIEISSEREAFSKRINLLIGAIDKIGLFPGLLALFVTLSNSETIYSQWIYIAAYVIPLLYFLGIAMHMELDKLERIEKLIDYAIEEKQ